VEDGERPFRRRAHPPLGRGGRDGERAHAGRHLDAAAAPLEPGATRGCGAAGPRRRGRRRLPHEDDGAGRGDLGLPRHLALGQGSGRPLLRGLPRGRRRGAARRAQRRRAARPGPCRRAPAVGRVGAAGRRCPRCAAGL
ncbi:MAG: hypothetical protein AVDCRST_MAG07-2017, partial [uncultured Frankineae bacterium]